MAGGKLRDGTDGRLFFLCPGCKTTHMIQHGSGPGVRWSWNGDAVRPTFSPSVLVRSGHYVQGGNGGDCWCSYEARTGEKSPPGFSCGVCHSFVRDGRIQFLNDCTHDLAGKTVDLPCFDDDE